MGVGKRSLGRRDVIKMTGGVGAAGLFAGCTGDDDGGDGDGDGTATEPPSLQAQLGQVGFELVSMPNTVAFREMLPEATDERFTGEIINMSGGTTQMPALISGQTDFALAAPGTIATAVVAGADLRIVATAVAGTDYVIGARDSVDGLSDFVESDIPMAANLGALSGNQVAGVFDQEGLDVDQVNFINVGGSSDRTAALASDNAKGAAIHFGQAQQLIDEGLPVKILVEVAEYYPNFVQNSIACRAGWLEDSVQEEYTQAYINQLYQANQRAQNDFDWLYSATQRFTAEPLNRETAMSSWELNNEYGAWPTSPLTLDAYESNMQMLDAANILDPDELDLETLLVPEYSETAIDELD